MSEATKSKLKVEDEFTLPQGQTGRIVRLESFGGVPHYGTLTRFTDENGETAVQPNWIPVQILDSMVSAQKKEPAAATPGLVSFLARMCLYVQDHIHDPQAWREESREIHLQCTSYAVACFLAQNTEDGDGGVEWGIVQKELVERPDKTLEQWEEIINDLVNGLGGLKGWPPPSLEDRRFTTFCRDLDDENSTTHITMVTADSMEQAAKLGLLECLSDWQQEPGGATCIGVARGDVDILLWDDESGVIPEEEEEDEGIYSAEDEAKVFILIPREKDTGIAPRSGIVATRTKDGKDFQVYYEGNLYGAENLKTWAERVFHAAGRMKVRAPTIAREVLDDEAFFRKYKIIGYWHWDEYNRASDLKDIWRRIDTAISIKTDCDRDQMQWADALD